MIVPNNLHRLLLLFIAFLLTNYFGLDLCSARFFKNFNQMREFVLTIISLESWRGTFKLKEIKNNLIIVGLTSFEQGIFWWIFFQKGLENPQYHWIFAFSSLCGAFTPILATDVKIPRLQRVFGISQRLKSYPNLCPRNWENSQSLVTLERTETITLGPGDFDGSILHINIWLATGQNDPSYRASHVLVDWVLLTWIWDVPPPCLGSR